jgi:hypothetical protein
MERNLAIYLLFIYLFFETGSHFIAYGDFELSILLPQPLGAEIIGMRHHV